MVFSFFSSIFLVKSFLFLFHLVFSYQYLLLKTVISLLLLEFLILLKYGDKFKLNKLSKLRKYGQNSVMQYKIVTKNDLLLTISYVLSYISIFILGILYLRIQNQNKEINLVEQYAKIKQRILESSTINLGFSLLILLLLILTAITIHKKLFNTFKFYLKAIHIYLYQYEIYDKLFWNNYKTKFPDRLLNIPSYTIDAFHSTAHDLLENLAFLLNLKKKSIATWTKDEYGHPHVTWTDYELSTWDYLQMDIRSYITRPLLFNLHYIILSFSLFFDLFLNHLTLKNYFYFLPFFFLYHNWIRFSSTVDQMGFGPPYDLMRLIYKNCYQEDNNLYSEDGEFVTNLTDGYDFLYTYLETFVHPDLENYFPSKGKILSILEKPIIFLLSTKIVKKIRKYNYRRQIIKIHKALTLH